jgi:hypothetical protein
LIHRNLEGAFSVHPLSGHCAMAAKSLLLGQSGRLPTELDDEYAP